MNTEQRIEAPDDKAAAIKALSFDDWIIQLDEDVIQGEYGFEDGEFTVYPEHWRGMFDEGLTPRQAYKRALDAWDASRQDEEAARLANYERITSEDSALLTALEAHQ
jgi:hypothetical protein